jgi:hypothetical protein
MKNILFFMAVFAANAAFAQWYSTTGYEKCMDTADGLWICREDYVNNFCYGKERTWINNKRERVFLNRGETMLWYDRYLVAVRNLNYKCEYHGWSRFRLADGSWGWKCYQNNREAEDSSCKGFTKR